MRFQPELIALLVILVFGALLLLASEHRKQAALKKPTRP